MNNQTSTGRLLFISKSKATWGCYRPIPVH